MKDVLPKLYVSQSGGRTGLEGKVPFQGGVAPGKAGIAAQGVAKLAPLIR